MTRLFYLVHKKSGKLVSVYGVTKDAHGYPHFIVYKQGQWRTVSAKNYKPCGEDEDGGSDSD